MRIIVNHLTRMKAGYICLAGVDVRTGHHVRPVTGGRPLEAALLRRHGGVVDVGALLDLGAVTNCGTPPEWEDHRFHAHALRHINNVSQQNFLAVLHQLAKDSMKSIFGPDLERHNGGYVVSVHGGYGSLGCFRPQSKVHIYINDHGRIRAAWDDQHQRLSLSVTDVRLYDTLLRPQPELVRYVAQRLAAGVPMLLTVGLARAWQKPGEDVKRHWLQVNNIYLADDPFLLQGQST